VGRDQRLAADRAGFAERFPRLRHAGQAGLSQPKWTG
jgi:hypothetical protein